MTTHSFIKINADTVRFHITHVVKKIHCQNFNDVNDVVYETSSIKCFYRGKLQLLALVCVTKVFEIYKKISKKENTGKRDSHNKRREDDDNDNNSNNDNG